MDLSKADTNNGANGLDRINRQCRQRPETGATGSGAVGALQIGDVKTMARQGHRSRTIGTRRMEKPLRLWPILECSRAFLAAPTAP
jgi:hypothetical protein